MKKNLFLMALLCLIVLSCGKDDLIMDKSSTGKTLVENRQDNINFLPNVDLSTDLNICCGPENLRLMDYPILETILLPVLETKLGSHDLKKIKDGTVSHVSNDNEDNYSITWDYFSNGVSKLIISFDKNQ